MLKKLVQRDRDRVLSYLEKNFCDCIYLCIDLEKYGVGHPEVGFWYSERKGEPYLVFMKYYDSIQVFCADDNWKAEEYAEWMNQFSVTMIRGNARAIQKLEGYLEGYHTAYGITVHETEYREFPQFSMVERAGVEDAMEIARLMCADREFGENYTAENLAVQIRDRMIENVGRNFIIRENGKIAAHVGTFIENAKAAVESGLIVDEKYKNKFYGLIVHEYLKKITMQEGKLLYAFRINDAMQRYTRAANESICGYYGKMTRG
ncbi:MAG: hypothetical protein HFI00_12710 [Lachnospiraceae bacterium]|jgi:hypothetical protein|nr:hypothetical protein [Lachnospiraceae bacterium]